MDVTTIPDEARCPNCGRRSARTLDRLEDELDREFARRVKAEAVANAVGRYVDDRGPKTWRQVEDALAVYRRTTEESVRG